MSLQKARIAENLMRLLQESNAREEKLKEREKELKQQVEHWHKGYDRINQEYLALKYDSICYDCIQSKRERGEGKTREICSQCNEKCQTKYDLQRRVKKLGEEVRYWQECYETLLEHDRRSTDGSC